MPVETSARRGSSEDHFEPVRFAVVAELDRRGRIELRAVEADRSDTFRHLIGILDLDLVGRAPLFVRGEKARPMFGDAGIDHQTIAGFELEAQYFFHAGAIDPPRTPGVPSPPAF